MATLVLDRSNLELRADGAALALYENGERRSTVPVNLLERVIFQGNIRIETGVLARLAEEGIAAVLLSRRQSRRVAFLLGPAHSDAAVRLGQYRLALDGTWCARWARRIIFGKTRAQARLLRSALDARPDRRKALTDALSQVEGAVTALRDAAGCEDPARIRGLEGAAALAHFRGLASLFPESLEFTGRNRRPPRDPVNACLSLGYTLLHFEAVRACYVAGLDPLIGFYHRAAFGRESMACDLVEPLRPRVDSWVWRLIRDRILRDAHFVRDKGACLLNKTGREHFYQAYEMFAPPLRRLLRRECAALARALRKSGESEVEPPLGDSKAVRGALSFWDVIPQIHGNSLLVEIMTPHQSHYYQWKKDDRGNPIPVSPHDSGQPTPIPFLTVPPGSGFTFHVVCDRAHLERLTEHKLDGAPDLLADSNGRPRWQALIEAAFEHAFEWLGFGAKTAVGYGAMQPRVKETSIGGPGPSATAPTSAATTAEWHPAKLVWDKGRQELKAVAQGKSTAPVKSAEEARKLFTDPTLFDRLEKKGTLPNARVQVRIEGNMIVLVKVF